MMIIFDKSITINLPLHKCELLDNAFYKKGFFKATYN
jgi:hypothetical protein